MMALPVIVIHSPLYLSSLYVSMFMFRCVRKRFQTRNEIRDDEIKYVKNEGEKREERGEKTKGPKTGTHGAIQGPCNKKKQDALMQIGAQ